MIRITLPEVELFDESTNSFETFEEVEVELEHSLVSLSKWESKWKFPFLGKQEKTVEQTLDYIRCMAIDAEIDTKQLHRLSQNDVTRINDYIKDSMTATWFNEKANKKGVSETITSELIYYWMVALQIPFECQEWHLNRLLTLIKVCNTKNAPEKKMSRSEIAAKNRALNEQRKAQLKTRG